MLKTTRVKRSKLVVFLHIGAVYIYVCIYKDYGELLQLTGVNCLQYISALELL